jgi:hypothetical protein
MKMIFRLPSQTFKVFITLCFLFATLVPVVLAEPQIIQSMKTTMYEYVADDEEIDIVAKWISDGAKNDAFFKEEVLTIMEYDCQNCHSKTSTMTDAAPDKPLMTYNEVVKYIQEAPAKATN